MSLTTRIKAKIKDLDALEAALKEFKGTLHRGVTQSKIYGSRTTTCDHKATFQGYNNMEIGLVKQQDGSYELVYDDMLERLIGKGAVKLIDAYEVHKAILDSVYMGYAASEIEREPDGTRVVEIQVMEY